VFGKEFWDKKSQKIKHQKKIPVKKKKSPKLAKNSLAFSIPYV